MWRWADLYEDAAAVPKRVSQLGRHSDEAAPGGESGGNVFQVFYISCVVQQDSRSGMSRWIPGGIVFGRLNQEPCAEWGDLVVNLLV